MVCFSGGKGPHGLGWLLFDVWHSRWPSRSIVTAYTGVHCLVCATLHVVPLGATYNIQVLDGLFDLLERSTSLGWL
jgi:hypothetical protein